MDITIPTALKSLASAGSAIRSGKSTEDLIESIYDKIGQLIIRNPHVSNNRNYRWTVRVNNIRKRIWLLLRHVRE